MSKAKAATPKGWPRPDRGTQEFVEMIVSTAVLALMMIHYVLQAFVIPTGSMAPTLLGEHLIIEDPATGDSYPLNRVTSSFTARSQYGDVDVTAFDKLPEEVQWTFGLGGSTPIYGGDKVLADKLSLRFKDPERFDICVFKYPVEPYRDFIKRIIGLPGERMRIHRGDLFANGERIVKPLEVQEAMWQKVYAQQRPMLDDARPEPWTPSEAGRWTIRRRGEGELPGSQLSLQDEAFIAKPGAGPTTLTYSRTILDRYEYNPVRDGERGVSFEGRHAVVDLRLSARVTPLGGESVTLRIVENGKPLSVIAPVGSGMGEWMLSREAEPGPEVAERFSGPKLAAGEAAELRFAWWDRRARVTLNGAELFVWDDPVAKASTERSTVELVAPAEGAVFEAVVVERDLFYVSHGYPSMAADEGIFDEATDEFIVPDDGFLAFGDNQPNSSDSRRWGLVRRDHLVGKALVVFWPPSRIGPIR